MPRDVAVLVGLACLFFASGVRAEVGEGESEAFFEAKIRPVLAGTCFPCHGGKKTSSALRVDSRAALIKGGETGPALIPGNPDGSLLVQALRYTHESIKMPPGKRIAEESLLSIVEWIRQGAYWPAESRSRPGFGVMRHWAFEPLRPTAVPTSLTEESANPIDRFVAARRSVAGLRVVPQADRRTLIRRLTIDLIGLPPTPEETADFLKDESPAAYSKLVERLLASPRYGERWGRHWLDVARYADTAGDNADYPVPELSRYRDYVIDAFNADMPYDQFVREQIAGDLVNSEGSPQDYARGVIATGFLALARRYATAPYELWHLSLEDAIDTTGRAFLGLILRCARCHDHKFDPITQKDYYALYGIFASTTFPYAGSEEFQTMNRPRQGFVPLVSRDQAKPKLEAFQAEVAQLESRVKEAEAALAKTPPANRKNETAELNRRKSELARKRRPGLPPDIPGAYALSEGNPVDVPIHRGGDPGDPGPVVSRGVPEYFTNVDSPQIPAQSSGRKELAEWLTNSKHPLPARVMVNRIWQHHFGKGIVASASNFGLRGDEPSHSELLDWLTARFIADGWTIKTIHRIILNSYTYQISSISDTSNNGKDPSNRLLWRFDRRRLDAESLRDLMLSVSGKLDPSRPAGQPFPPIEQWHWTQHNAFKDIYATNRRSVFLMTQRLQRHPYLALFDGPDTNVSTDVRTRATVPLQALYLMNNPFVTECSQHFASRLIASCEDPKNRTRLAIQLAYNRPANEDEIERFLDYEKSYRQLLARSNVPLSELEFQSWTSLARIILTANEFLYVD